MYLGSPNEYLIQEKERKKENENITTDSMNRVSIDTSEDYYPDSIESQKYSKSRNRGHRNLVPYKKYDNHVNSYYNNSNHFNFL